MGVVGDVLSASGTADLHPLPRIGIGNALRDERPWVTALLARLVHVSGSPFGRFVIAFVGVIVFLGSEPIKVSGMFSDPLLDPLCRGRAELSATMVAAESLVDESSSAPIAELVSFGCLDDAEGTQKKMAPRISIIAHASPFGRLLTRVSLSRLCQYLENLREFSLKFDLVHELMLCVCKPIAITSGVPHIVKCAILDNHESGLLDR
jgi:hypothetical protein